MQRTRNPRPLDWFLVIWLLAVTIALAWPAADALQRVDTAPVGCSTDSDCGCTDDCLDTDAPPASVEV